MCTEVLVKLPSGNVLCKTVGELAKALGLRARKVSPDPYNYCLCNAYLDGLGAREPDEGEGEGYIGMTVVIDRVTTARPGR